MKKLRIVFFGTPDFAVASADAIFEAGYEIAAVVTAPDKHAGRGHRLLESPVKQWAMRHNLPVLQPSNLKEEKFLEDLKSFKANLFVVIAFRMLPEIVWNMPELGTFNLHASLLPRYRGAAPINHAIIAGETVTGVTTFFLKHEIDTGDIILQRSIEIDPSDNAGSLHDKLMHLGAQVSLETLQKISSGDIDPIPQANTGLEATPAPKIFHETCFINWNTGSTRIKNFVRGLSPYPAARTYLQFPCGPREEYKIFEIGITDNVARLAPGELRIEDGKILIGSADNVMEILSLQAQGKRRLNSRDFLNGLRKNTSSPK